ncbi:MAG: response regulator [Candidatus Micrarchaeia archaeon]
MKVLVVDDSVNILPFYKDALATQGIETETAASGPEALAKLSLEEFDLLITDYRMPDMSGCELAKNVLEKFPGKKVLILSNMPGDAKAEAQRLGIEERVSVREKPSELTELKALAEYVRELLMAKTAPATEKLRVLIVDDEEMLIKAYTRALWGLRDVVVETAKDGNEALEKLSSATRQNAPFALIITDFNMPGMNGCEFAQKARETHPEARIVINTSNPDDARREVQRIGIAIELSSNKLLGLEVKKLVEATMAEKNAPDTDKMRILRDTAPSTSQSTTGRPQKLKR